jgi:hypothetical protein
MRALAGSLLFAGRNFKEISIQVHAWVVFFELFPPQPTLQKPSVLCKNMTAHTFLTC